MSFNPYSGFSQSVGEYPLPKIPVRKEDHGAYAARS